MRTILLLLAVWVAILVIARIWRYKQIQKRRAAQTGREPVEQMVRCAHCRTHLPVSQALEKDGDYYCSAEHLRKHAQS